MIKINLKMKNSTVIRIINITPIYHTFIFNIILIVIILKYKIRQIITMY